MRRDRQHLAFGETDFGRKEVLRETVRLELDVLIIFVYAFLKQASGLIRVEAPLTDELIALFYNREALTVRFLFLV